MITDLPMPSARKRTLVDPTVETGDTIGACSPTGAATGSSAARAGVRTGWSVSAATAESDSTRAIEVHVVS